MLPSMTLKGFQGNPDSQNWFAEEFLSTGFVGLLFLHCKIHFICKTSHFGQILLLLREMQGNIWCHFHMKGIVITSISPPKTAFLMIATAGRFGVHLVREISPWSSQVLCIGLAQNLKPILSDDKYWNINPNISAFGM